MVLCISPPENVITMPINRAPDHRDFVWQAGLGKTFEFRKMTGEHTRINHFEVEIPPGNNVNIKAVRPLSNSAVLKKRQRCESPPEAQRFYEAESKNHLTIVSLFSCKTHTNWDK